jgi:hypothetical protein
MASLQVQLKIDLADRGLFKRGTAGALELAANGYWLDNDEFTVLSAHQ